MGGYRRVLLKLSGQSLGGPDGSGLHQPTVEAMAKEIAAIREDGRQVGVVIGAGNIFRGVEGASRGLDRVTGDQMGMLATVMNCLALEATLRELKVPTRLMTATPLGPVGEPFRRNHAVEELEAGRVLLFGGGTGSPFFTTDSAAALRACEIGADALLKATRVDGVYDRDPEKHADAKRYDRLTYGQVLREDLKVMDTAAFALCRDGGIPIVVFDLHKDGNVLRAARGEDVGTVVAD